MTLENHRVLITGGTRGIGRAIVVAMTAAGARVAFVYRASEDAARNLERETGAIPIRADFSDLAAVKPAAIRAAEALGGLDALVNNAAMLIKCPAAEITPEHWQQVMTTNVSAAFFAVQAALPYLKASPNASILNLTSQAAFTGSIGGLSYSTSKSALLGLTYSLAKELGPQGIRANLIAPGRIETDMIAYGTPERRAEWLKDTPLGYFGDPADIASAAVYLTSPAARYVTGTTLHVNGGMLMS